MVALFRLRLFGVGPSIAGGYYVALPTLLGDLVEQPKKHRDVTKSLVSKTMLHYEHAHGTRVSHSSYAAGRAHALLL